MPYGTVQADKVQGSFNSFSPDSAFFRNRIINGAMIFDQRNAGFSVTASVPTTRYTLDRWQVYFTVGSKLNIERDSISFPSGFNNSLKVTTIGSTTPGSTDEYSINQIIEGFNVADLGFGTASAQTITLSFWVRSSLTGTFGGALRNSGGTRSYPYSYTISAANTWEYKTITIPGDTTGTWLKNNSAGFLVGWSLGNGSTNQGTAGAWVGSNKMTCTGETQLVGTASATWQITGVQLEAGSTATSFEYRPIGTELALCQRYYQVFYGNGVSSLGGLAARINATGAGSGIQANIPLKVTMRVAATGTKNGIWTTNNCDQPSAYSDGEILYVYSSCSAAGDAYFYATGSHSITISAEL